MRRRDAPRRVCSCPARAGGKKEKKKQKYSCLSSRPSVHIVPTGVLITMVFLFILTDGSTGGTSIWQSSLSFSVREGATHGQGGVGAGTGLLSFRSTAFRSSSSGPTGVTSIHPPLLCRPSPSTATATPPTSLLHGTPSRTGELSYNTESIQGGPEK